MENSTITAKQYNDACAKYPPSELIKFMFKHFSSNTEKEDMKLSRTIMNILVILFAIMFFGVAFEVGVKILVPFIIAYCAILIPLGVLIFLTVKFNNLRHDKIRKELGGITKSEYEKLIYKFNP